MCLGPAQQKMDCNIGCPGESLEFIIRGTREEEENLLSLQAEGRSSLAQPADLACTSLLRSNLLLATSPEEYLTCKRAEREKVSLPLLAAVGVAQTADE